MKFILTIMPDVAKACAGDKSAALQQRIRLRAEVLRATDEMLGRLGHDHVPYMTVEAYISDGGDVFTTGMSTHPPKYTPTPVNKA